MPEFGTTGLRVPRIVLGTSTLGNLYQAQPESTKLAIVRQALRGEARPILLDSAGKYGAGLSLEVIGRSLRALGVQPEEVLISNKLGWRRVPLRASAPTFEPGAWFGLEHDAEQDIGYQGILRCWEQGNSLLGAPFRPALVSVHDPDEYLGRAAGAGERARAEASILEAYRALVELKQAAEVRAVGVGSKDWRVIRWLVDEVDLDWVMLACSLTIYTHAEEVVDFVDALGRRGIGVINSAVFQAGFLAGGAYFDYRRLDPDDPEAQHLFAWRDRFFDVCRQYDVTPAAACVGFALSPPAVASVALNPSSPEQAAANLALADADIPAPFWLALKDAGLIRREYPYLG